MPKTIARKKPKTLKLQKQDQVDAVVIYHYFPESDVVAMAKWDRFWELVLRPIIGELMTDPLADDEEPNTVSSGGWPRHTN